MCLSQQYHIIAKQPNIVWRDMYKPVNICTWEIICPVYLRTVSFQEQKWSETWNKCLLRKDWRNWDCSVWKREVDCSRCVLDLKQKGRLKLEGRYRLKNKKSFLSVVRIWSKWLKICMLAPHIIFLNHVYGSDILLKCFFLYSDRCLLTNIYNLCRNFCVCFRVLYVFKVYI